MQDLKWKEKRKRQKRRAKRVKLAKKQASKK